MTTNATLGTIEPTSSRINGRPVHRVHYVFTDQTGVEHAGAGSTTDSRQLLPCRNPLSIEYDPKAPERSRLKGGSAVVLRPLHLASARPFFVVGTIVFAFGARRVRAVRAIYVHGHPARAQVTAVTPTAMGRSTAVP